MPLVPDGRVRGPHATHVCFHRKLEKHRTVINAALVLVNQLIDDSRVRQVQLGRIYLPNSEPFAPRVQAQAKGRKIEMTLFGVDAVQVIGVTTESATVAEAIADFVRQSL